MNVMTVGNMAKCYVFLVLLLFCTYGLFAFNLDVEEPQIYGGNAHSGEFFGYSVALDSWGAEPSRRAPVLIGAPLGNKTGLGALDNRLQYGSVYRCGLNSAVCDALAVDTSVPDQAEYNGRDYDIELKTGQMLGATIVAKKDKFLVCAPRYTRIKLPTSATQPDKQRTRYMIGKCVFLKDFGYIVRPELIPCIDRYQISGGGEKYKMCQAGFSAGLDSAGKIAAMGLPGFKGTISIGFYKVKEQRYPVAKTDSLKLDFGDMMGYALTTGFFKDKSTEEYVSSSPRADKFKGKVVIYGLTVNEEISIGSYYPKNNDGIQEGSYFGAALCAVDLNNDELSDLLVGAPYYTDQRDEGRVYVYMNNGNGALNLNKDIILKGDNKKDARFGLSIAAVGDLNYDGYQDVAIGAPYEDGVGAVYIYFGASNGINLSQKARQKVLASKYGAMKALGFSVAGGVDADSNGYPDVLIGAVESNQAILLRTRPLIVVRGTVKLNTQQIVLETNDAMCQASDKTMRKCIEATICFSFTLKNPKQKKGKVEVSYTVELDKNIPFRRLYIENVNSSSVMQTSYKANFSLGTEAGKEKCETKRTILLKQNKQIGDLVNPLTFDLSYTLQNPPSCAPDLCPLLDVLSGDSYRAEARFLKHCKTQQVCKPDLAITGNVTFRGRESYYDKIFIGLVDTLFVNVDLKNNDEDAAYSSQVIIEYPPALSYIGPGPDKEVLCETQKIAGSIWQKAVCATGNPLRGKTQKKFYVEFSAIGIQGNISDFDIIVKATSAADEKSYQKDDDNKLTLPVKVTKEADLALEGFSEPDQVVYKSGFSGTITRVDQLGAGITQKIIVKNRGPSSVDGSTVNISVPVIYDADDPRSFLIYLITVEAQGGSCTVQTNTEDLARNGNTTVPKVGESKSDVKSRSKRDSSGKVSKVNCKHDQKRCLTFTCNIGELNQGDSIVIEMFSRLWQSTLYKANAGSVDLVTVATVSLPPGINEPTEGMKNKEKQIIMRANPETVTAKSKKLQWWPILLAVLGGLLLLAGAVFLMYKKGFFKRKQIGDPPANSDEMSPMKNAKCAADSSDA